MSQYTPEDVHAQHPDLSVDYVLGVLFNLFKYRFSDLLKLPAQEAVPLCTTETASGK